MIIECKYCGKKTRKPPSKVRLGAKYCSVKCRVKGTEKVADKSHLWKGGGVRVVCARCGAEFITKKSRLKKGWGKFCGNKCKIADQSERQRSRVGAKNINWHGGSRVVPCAVCGKEVTRIPAMVANGRKNFCSLSCAAVWTIKHHIKTKNTDIEIILRAGLEKSGIVFTEQHPIKEVGTVVDFFIHPNLCVYADGDYWHRLPDRAVKDAEKTKKLTSCGYKVIRFWGTEIKADTGKCVDVVAKEIGPCLQARERKI